MGTTTSRLSGKTAVLAALALVSSLFALTVVAPAPAHAATYEVVGQISGPQAKLPKIKVRWFTQDWAYLGERTVRNDIYSLSLAPGTYHLQFVDQRPSYDVTKYAPADLTVTVKDRKIQKNVKMQRGAAITGTVRAGGKVAKGARVVAANTYEQSYETTANKAGQFAIGGLPTGKYSVFTYDRTETWVDKSLYAGKIKRGKAFNTAISLKKRGGSLLVDLFHADGSRATGKFAVTAVSKKTGQFWTANAKHGKVTFRGLYPGGYTLVAPGNGDYLAQTGPIQGANVRAGKADLASRFVWTKHGATVSGRAVDGTSRQPLGSVVVTLYSGTGQVLASTTTDGAGQFFLTGQLVTTANTTVQVRPGGSNPPYMTTGGLYCKFDQADHFLGRISTGQNTEAGDLALPRSAAQDSDACAA
jgi:hypothetical protein